MIKADITEMLYEKIGFSKQEATRLTETFFNIMKEALEKEGLVKISGFGNFVVRRKKARRGRNPHTGEKITITPRRVLTFKTSPILRKALNKKSR